MAASKKLYVPLAAAVEDSLARTHDPAATAAIHTLTRKVAAVLKHDNPTFDVGRFLQAAGILATPQGADPLIGWDEPEDPEPEPYREARSRMGLGDI